MNVLREQQSKMENPQEVSQKSKPPAANKFKIVFPPFFDLFGDKTCYFSDNYLRHLLSVTPGPFFEIKWTTYSNDYIVGCITSEC